MPRSPFKLEIPATDILSYIFPEEKQPSDKPIWIDADDTSNSLSPQQLLSLVKRFGLGLDRLGIRKGEAVMMYTRNHILTPAFYLTVAGTGRIFTGCNPAYGVNETVYQLKNTGAQLLLVEPMFLDTVLQAADEAGLPRQRIFLFSDKPCETRHGINDWRTLLSSEQEAQEWSWHRMSPEESRGTTATLNYSSGTTGLPKGVMISHQNIVANVEQSIYMRKLEQPQQSGPAPAERWLGFLPLFHAYGQLWSIMAAAKTDTPVYFMREFQYDCWLANIEKHRITHIQTAPPVLVMLAKRPETDKYDLSSLVNILCGAAPLSKELQNEVSDKLDLKIVQTWGMTEVTCSCLHVPGGLDDRSGSVGYIDPNSEIKLIDDDGKEVGPHERGEIHVRGPNVCLGYWKNAEATSNSFDQDGFLKTGDVAMRDENGWHWIVDRKKELIKVKGFQVAPAELEAVLLENEHVADADRARGPDGGHWMIVRSYQPYLPVALFQIEGAHRLTLYGTAVCGVHTEYEELPRAYVVLKDASKGKVSPEDIQEWTAEQVARHKKLDGGVKFIDEVPKSSSGKIQRVIMREWAKKDAEEMKPKAKL